MKTYSITYIQTIINDVVVRAKNQREAKQKVLDVIGVDTVIDFVWEVKPTKWKKL